MNYQLKSISLLSSLLLTACATGLTQKDHRNRPDTQIAAADLSISASPALPFDLVRAKLRPNDPAKSASEYRAASVERTLAIIEQQSVSTGTGFSANLPGSAITKSAVEQSTSETVDGVTTDSSTISNNRTATLIPGERPSGTVSAPANTAALALAGFSAGIDLELAFEAGDFLYQRAKLNDSYYDIDLDRPGMEAWVMRLQVTVQPRMRDMPYDIRAKLNVTGDEGANVQLVPLFATGNYETSSYQNLASQLQQLNLNLTAISGGTGLSAGMERRVAEVLERIGTDINTKVSVGVDGPNSVNLSLPAAFSPRSEYELRDQTYTITLLAFVESAECNPLVRSNALTVSADWEMVDASSAGKIVPLVDAKAAKALALKLENQNMEFGELIRAGEQVKSRLQIINASFPVVSLRADRPVAYSIALENLKRDIAAFDSLYASLFEVTHPSTKDVSLTEILKNANSLQGLNVVSPDYGQVRIDTMNGFEKSWTILSSMAEARLQLMGAEPIQNYSQSVRQTKWFRRGMESLHNPKFASLPDLSIFRERAWNVFGNAVNRDIKAALVDMSQPQVRIPLVKADRRLAEFQLAELIDDGKSSAVVTIGGVEAIPQDKFSASLYATGKDISKYDSRKLCKIIEKQEGFFFNDSEEAEVSELLTEAGGLEGPYVSRSTSLSGTTLKMNFPSLVALGQTARNEKDGKGLILRVETEKQTCLPSDGSSEYFRAYETDCYLVAKNMVSSGKPPPAPKPFTSKLISEKISLRPPAGASTGSTATATLSIQDTPGVTPVTTQYKVTIQNGTLGSLSGKGGSILVPTTPKLTSENAFLMNTGSVIAISINDVASGDVVNFSVAPIDKKTGKVIPNIDAQKLTATVR